MTDKLKKALPLFFNGAAFIALGIFALSAEPSWWQPLAAFVASGLNILFGVKWNVPTSGE